MDHLVSCPVCGFTQEGANFCRQCGASLRDAARAVSPDLEPVTFPWGLFAWFLLGVFLLAALIGGTGIRPEVIQPVLLGLVLASAVWVAFDGHRKRVPRPWIWFLAVWLFWLVSFPWYLKRRQHPDRPCVLDSPRNRAEVVRLLVTVAVLIFFLLALGRFLASRAGS